MIVTRTERPHGLVRRMVITSIDSITEMLKDYTEGQIPVDARPIKLMLKPTERGKLGILMEADGWEDDKDSPIEVKFEFKRMYGVI